MANEAHKEPTMEEILASIRKIIADDTPPASPASAAREETASPAAKDLVFENDSDIGMFEGDLEPATAAHEELISGPEFSFEEMLGAPRAAEVPPRAEPPVQLATPSIRKPTSQKSAPETPMPASPRQIHAPLTDEQTADAAAGALGKLISRMDIGSDNTLEGLVRELVKPMIKEWLDANLARIVEEKVEAEVERIARMVR
ncbi:DUF2497 domain-containing protein [Hyphomonas sp.]|uniref:DUF2497 domain-containing protein n=1 Tax=Hyphomonas sp. TaxID=87 RepID=UPI0039187D36